MISVKKVKLDFTQKKIFYIIELVAFVFTQDEDSELDSNWDDLFPDPQNDKTMLKLYRGSIINLVEGVKHYNSNLHSQELLFRCLEF